MHRIYVDISLSLHRYNVSDRSFQLHTEFSLGSVAADRCRRIAEGVLSLEGQMGNCSAFGLVQILDSL